PTYSTQGAFVAADGTPGPEFFVGSGQSPHLAVGGDVALVVRSVTNRSDTRNLHDDIHGTCIHSDGTVLDGFVISNRPGTETAPAVAWDGSQFVVDWWDGHSGITQQPRADIYGARVSRTGVVLEQFAVANSSQPEDTPFVAARDGLTVFAYAKFYDEAPYAAYRITLRTAQFPSPDPVALPAAPSNLAASHDGGNFSLTWVDNSTNEIGFKLERRTAAFAPNWGEFARVGPNVTSYAAGPGLAGDFEATFYRVRAFNAAGDSGYSNEVSPPRVRITGPPVGSTYDEPATVTVTADAADADGQIARVEFYVNGVLAGTDTTAPYAVTLNALPAGDYNLRARATDNGGQTATTQDGTAGFGVFARPSATITSPAEGANFPDAPASVQISATAQVPPTGQSGEFVNRMDFYANGNLIGTVGGRLAAYNFEWGNVAAGAYLLTAVPTTNWLRTGTSNSVRVTVGPPPPPAAGGLYYHPLPNPIRLLDTRPGQLACDVPGAPLTGGGTRTEAARVACTGIPASAQVIVGNATVVNSVPGATGGFITLYPSGASQPTVSNLNYVAGQVVPNAFTVGLGSGDGAFNIFASSSTHFIVDIAGYFAP
nr:hypothetical protein [Pyrinomonadaceae bacterium]